MSELREQIKQIIETEPVSVFMKGTPQLVMCGNSDRALRALKAAGAPITAVDVLPDPRIRQELSALSGWPTIPQVFIRGELVGGADIVEELYESGELRQRLDEALGEERDATVRADGVDRMTNPLPDPVPPAPPGPTDPLPEPMPQPPDPDPGSPSPDLPPLR